jgi:small-conductance mechanosensitive channel
MIELEKILDRTFWGNTVWEWSVAAAILVVTFLVLGLIRRVIRTNYTRLAATPRVEFMELPLRVVSRTTLPFILMLSLFFGLESLKLPARAHTILVTAVTIAAFWQIGLWATTAVLGSLERKQRAAAQVDRAAVGTLTIISFIIRTTIWSFVLLLTLDNLGVEIKPLLAGLGIGGIAVALAVQNVLGDLLASLSITLDRPFVVGESLAVDDFNGTVEYIGVKSTRLRSLSGEQIIIPNSNLLSSRIRNNSRMSERRAVFTISVSPQTPVPQLVKIAGMIRGFVESHADVRFDRAHFAKIGPTSFDFEIVYIVTQPDYNRYMDIQQAINLQIVDAFDQGGIALAYPTQRLKLEHETTTDVTDPSVIAPRK